MAAVALLKRLARRQRYAFECNIVPSGSGIVVSGIACETPPEEFPRCTQDAQMMCILQEARVRPTAAAHSQLGRRSGGPVAVLLGEQVELLRMPGAGQALR